MGQWWYPLGPGSQPPARCWSVAGAVPALLISPAPAQDPSSPHSVHSYSSRENGVEKLPLGRKEAVPLSPTSMASSSSASPSRSKDVPTVRTCAAALGACFPTALNPQGCGMMPGGWGGPLPCWTPVLLDPHPMSPAAPLGSGLGTRDQLAGGLRSPPSSRRRVLCDPPRSALAGGEGRDTQPQVQHPHVPGRRRDPRLQQCPAVPPCCPQGPGGPPG